MVDGTTNPTYSGMFQSEVPAASGRPPAPGSTTKTADASMPHLTLSEAFLIFVLVLIPVMVYADATDHRIGKHPAAAGGMSAGAWASLAFIPFVGPAVAFYYLISRSEMLRRAQLHPVIIPEDRRDWTCFLILAGGLTGYGLVAAYADASRTDRRPAHHEISSQADGHGIGGDP
jgi:hypothetical protein